MNLPNKKYNIIYADPAWSYNGRLPQRGKIQHYPVMEHEDICALPVNEIATDNACLFLWVTFPKLEDGLKVIKSWGFEYKNCAFVFVKKNKRQDSYFWGLGGWTRSNAELCLLAHKGKPTRQAADVHQIVCEPIREHSRKPDCVRDRIVKLCGNLPRIELFARHKTPGWNVWGNEV